MKEPGKSARPRRVLILGNAKMGSTGVFNSIKAGMLEVGDPARLLCVSEPSASVASAIARYAAEDDVLVKAMINKTGRAISPAFYGHSILLVRDPRDTLVSQLLYYPLQPYGMRRTKPAEIERFLEALRAKEADPGGVPFRELFELAVQFMEWDPGWTWARYCSRFEDTHWYAENGAPFLLSYESFIADRLDGLSSYLELDVSNIVTGPETRTGHVVRSAESGGWRHWLTPADVEFFRPLLQDYMQRFGYDDDWGLADRPTIDPALSSEYVVRKRQKVAETFAVRFVDQGAWTPESVTEPDQLRRMIEASDDGGGGSSYRLGLLHRLGNALVPADPSRAIVFARRGALVGSRDCMALLADLYRNGEGVPADQAKAWFWLVEARKEAERSVRELQRRVTALTDERRAKVLGRATADSVPPGAATVPGRAGGKP